MMEMLKRLMKRVPAVARLAAERDRLRAEKEALASELETYKTWVPPGHYYSPLHDLRTIRKEEQRLFGARPREFAAIDLNLERQWKLLEQVEAIYSTIPFGEEPRAGLRYDYSMQRYTYLDAIAYYAMLAIQRPKRVIEVGCGHSTLLLLDANERLFGGGLEITLIEPYPELLKELLSAEEFGRRRLLQRPIQEVAPEEFERLEAGDFLFIDSTHVGKAGSDVNHIFFDVLPRLKTGVFVHFHDVFYPFEYPKENIYYGIAWNELYMLRAFLEYNPAWEIALWPTCLLEFDRGRFEQRMPLALKNTGGHIWLRKRQ